MVFSRTALGIRAPEARVLQVRILPTSPIKVKRLSSTAYQAGLINRRIDMGLDCSHDAWHGAYSAFMTWRRKIAEVAGLPPLDLMDGFYTPLSGHKLPTLYHGVNTREKSIVSERPPLAWLDDNLPISWECLKPSPLHELLYHSDCDGDIPAENCGAIADELEKLMPLLPDTDAGGHIGNWREKTQKFISGLRLAAESGESLDFH